MSGRIPCINPCCKRTASADKFSGEIICGKCFRKLPKHLQQEHRFRWKEYRKWDRRIARTADPLKIPKMRDIRGMWAARIDANWADIKATFVNPEKPEGLDAFLEELGL